MAAHQARKPSGGILSGVTRMLGFIILLSVFVAVLRVFDWDIVSLIAWCWDTVTSIIFKISDVIAESRLFQQIFSKPE